MRSKRFVRSLLLLAPFILLGPAVARAQSTVAGVVRDATGAVLPGVTVEASSPVLIEKMRSAVTDGDGRYAIVDLRPGTYTVTFTLSGFNAVRLEQIIVPANVSVPLNPEMKVGSLEETITVAGASPVVDVQNVSRVQVMTRDMMDNIPNARNIQAVGSLVPGVRLTVPEVGGTQQTEQTYMTVHGNSQVHTAVMMDGLAIHTNLLDGATQNYIDNLAIEEASYKTSGVSAESSRGGVNVNLIPKDGGNALRGSAYFGGSNGDWQSNNVTSDLESRGLLRRNSSRMAEIGDYNGSLGGPIVPDRLWFFGSGRYQVTDTLVANATERDNTTPALQDENIKSFYGRLTWQATPRNKFSGSYQRNFKYVGHEFFTGFAQPTSVPQYPEAAQYREPVLYYIATAKWSSPVTSKLLLESGIGIDILHYTNAYRPEVQKVRGTPEWYATASRLDSTLGFRTVAGFPAQIQSPDQYTWSSSLTYVTGSHNLKTGVQWGWGNGNAGGDANADLVQNYSNGTPTSVTVYLTPFNVRPTLDADLGIYAQDQWAIKRLTINAGVRYEYLRQSLPDVQKAAGRFSPAAIWPAVNCALVKGFTCWHNVVPRVGAAYDLSGNGKTALKFSFGAYMTPNTSSFAAASHPAQQFNPGAQTRTWRDGIDVDPNRLLPTTGDNIAQDSEIGRNPNPDYGIRIVRNIDPDISREFNRQYSAGIQHQVMQGVSLGFNWYRRTLHNSQFTDNLLLNGRYTGSDADWSPTTIVNPLSGERITAFRINQAKAFIAPDNLTTNFTKSDDRRNIYTGFESFASARLKRNVTAYAAWTMDRTMDVTCDASDNPNTLRFCDQTGNARLGEPAIDLPFRHEVKFGGNLPLWYGFEASAALQSYAGAAKNVLWTITPDVTRYPADCAVAGCVPNAIVMPSRFGSDPAIAPITAIGTGVALVAPGSRYLPRVNQLDFGVKRTFRLAGNRRIQAEFNIYNFLNNNAVLTELQTLGQAGTVAGTGASQALFADGAPGGRPTGIMYPRIMRLAASVRF